jgi:branched-chain amino acid transport system ATP-binding protein
MSLLELKHVSRRFGAVNALNDISLSVEQGELRAVIGPNGAGKTTLFNLISGFFPPSDGEVIFDSEKITAVNPASLVKRGIIRTFQITEIFLDLTVYENLRVAVETAQGLNLRPWIPAAKKRAVHDRVEELMSIVNIAGKQDRIAGELSHGDQRVVEVGIALSRQPKLLLLDEPTAGMGDEETNHMTDLIRSLNKVQKITMLFIEHDMNIVFGVADRITVLDNGTMLAEGNAKEIAANPRVQAAYLGRPAWPQRRRQNHHDALHHGPDAATRGDHKSVRQEHHEMAALSHRAIRRGLRAGGPENLWPSDSA